jgi:hypothetical protein
VRDAADGELTVIADYIGSTPLPSRLIERDRR